jgi:hypothetical protein
MRRALASFNLLVLLTGGIAVAQPVVSDAELQAGIRQVKEGDFETAVVTLDRVARRLATDPARARDRVQAGLYLGVALVALDQREAAKARFKEAIALDRELRLSAERFSPKVIAIFEEARREAAAEAARAAPAGATKKSGSKAPWIIGLGVAAAGGTFLATRGDDQSSGSLSLTNARFMTPVIVCPDGSLGLPIEFTLLVEARNGTNAPVTVSSVSTVVRIETSAIPSEIGFSSTARSDFSPAILAAGANTTLRIDSTLTCDNAVGDAPRFNEWSGHLTVTTTAGLFTLVAVDRLRVNIP